MGVRSSTTRVGGKEKGDGIDKATSHSFVLCNSKTWSTHPKTLRERHSQLLFTEAASGDDGEMFVTEDLCRELLKDDTNFQQMERECAEAFQA